MEAYIEQENERLLRLLSRFLVSHSRAITPDMLAQLRDACAMSAQEAYALLLASACGLDVAENAADRALYNRVFPNMVHRLDAADFRADPYYQAVRIPSLRSGAWELRTERYQPCEAFVCDDLHTLPNGRIIPQIGFFEEAFDYPAVLENGREWMTITPNEIITMRPAVEAAQGKVLTYGLGLGYFAFMSARKQAVTSVTVVERDAQVLRLFERHILPCFEHPEKVRLMQADAFAYAEQRMGAEAFDVVFTDLWHDPSDGLALYRRMKKCEPYSPHSRYLYWIERTLLAYLKESE